MLSDAPSISDNSNFLDEYSFWEIRGKLFSFIDKYSGQISGYLSKSDLIPRMIVRLPSVPADLRPSILSLFADLTAEITESPFPFLNTDLIGFICSFITEETAQSSVDNAITALTNILDGTCPTASCILSFRAAQNVISLIKSGVEDTTLKASLLFFGQLFLTEGLDSVAIIKEFQSILSLGFSRSSAEIISATLFALEGAITNNAFLVSNGFISHQMCGQIIEALSFGGEEIIRSSLRCLILMFSEGSKDVCSHYMGCGILDAVSSLFRAKRCICECLQLLSNISLSSRKNSAEVINHEVIEFALSEETVSGPFEQKRFAAKLFAACAKKSSDGFLDFLRQRKEIVKRVADFCFIGDFDIAFDIFNGLRSLTESETINGGERFLEEIIEGIGLNTEMLHDSDYIFEDGAEEAFLNELTKM